MIRPYEQLRVDMYDEMNKAEQRYKQRLEELQSKCEHVRLDNNLIGIGGRVRICAHCGKVFPMDVVKGNR